METNTAEQLLKILEEQLGEKVSLDTSFEEMGMDSLDFMEFITEIRSTLGPVSDKEVFSLTKPRDVLNLLDAKIA